MFFADFIIILHVLQGRVNILNERIFSCSIYLFIIRMSIPGSLEACNNGRRLLEKMGLETVCPLFYGLHTSSLVTLPTDQEEQENQSIAC